MFIKSFQGIRTGIGLADWSKVSNIYHPAMSGLGSNLGGPNIDPNSWPYLLSLLFSPGAGLYSGAHTICSSFDQGEVMPKNVIPVIKGYQVTLSSRVESYER